MQVYYLVSFSILFSPIRPFAKSTCIISKSTISHDFTISSTFVTLSFESLEICIIPDCLPLNSTMAPTHSMIFTTFPEPINHTSGTQRSSLMIAIAAFPDSCVFAVIVVSPSSAIEITTS